MESVLITNITVEELLQLLESSFQRHIQSNTNPESETVQWMDIETLREYLPDKPVKATVYAWVHGRSIPFYKGTKKLRFLKSEIDKWLQNGRQMTFHEISKKADANLKTLKNYRHGK